MAFLFFYTVSMEKQSSTASKNHESFPHYKVILTLLTLSILLSLISIYFLIGSGFSKMSDKVSETSSGSYQYQPVLGLGQSVYNTIMGIEYEKVGGKKNYDLLQEANIIQLEQQLPQIEEYIQANGGNGTDASGTTTQTTDQNKGTFTQEEVANLLKDAYVEGNVDADIVFIEYSDMECPFCIRQEVETKPYDAIQKQFPDLVGHVFKNNR